jgi:predicted nucleic acid-binding protein
MMVVDASAIIAVLFDEPTRDTVAARIRGRSLNAPILLPFEVASACLKKMRRVPAERLALMEAFRTLEEWEIAYHDIDLAEAVRVGEQTGLAVYDAAYLLLARDLSAELVTLDEKLNSAAASAS